jgi:hypothetical protein
MSTSSDQAVMPPFRFYKFSVKTFSLTPQSLGAAPPALQWTIAVRDRSIHRRG